MFIVVAASVLLASGAIEGGPWYECGTLERWRFFREKVTTVELDDSAATWMPFDSPSLRKYGYFTRNAPWSYSLARQGAVFAESVRVSPRVMIPGQGILVSFATYSAAARYDVEAFCPDGSRSTLVVVPLEEAGPYPALVVLTRTTSCDSVLYNSALFVRLCSPSDTLFARVDIRRDRIPE
jgi:hypothetical protein